jgi:hypothetical protein
MAPVKCDQCGSDRWSRGELRSHGTTLRFFNPRKYFSLGVRVDGFVCLDCGHVIPFVDEAGLQKVRAWHVEDTGK